MTKTNIALKEFFLKINKTVEDYNIKYDEHSKIDLKVKNHMRHYVIDFYYHKGNVSTLNDTWGFIEVKDMNHIHGKSHKYMATYEINSLFDLYLVTI